jgi:hypothetical protein
MVIQEFSINSSISLEAKVEQATQFDIINRILEMALDVAPPGWREFMINYYVEGGHTAMVNSVVVDKDGGGGEESLPDMYDLAELLLELRVHLAQAGRTEFTQCKIHVKSDGEYEAMYGYDKVDWADLVRPDWNFFPKSEVP